MSFDFDEDLSKELSSPITLEDLRCLIKIPDGIEDSYIIEFTKKHQESTIERSLKFLNQQIDDIRENWPGASPVQIYIAYELCNNDIESLLLKLDDINFKIKVNEAIEERITGNIHHEKEEDHNSEEEEDYNDDSDFDASFSDPKIDDKDQIIYSCSGEHKKRTRRRKEETVPISPDEPKPREIKSADWSHWSSAKRKSYLQGIKNPNAYFYRNTAPGEEYKTGPFTTEEKKIFLKRVEEFRDPETGGITGEWGLFSRALPGRVGYQCSNFYRKLVEQGEIKDPCYVRGSDGVLRHMSRLKNASTSGLSRPKVVKKSKMLEPYQIKSLQLVYSPPTTPTPEQKNLSMYERYALQNPIPGWTDPLTGEEMKVPAISPDYSLLDYNTWLHTIQSKPEDPFTQKPITKRQLIILNKENWPEYKEIIMEKYYELQAPKNIQRE